MAKVWASSENLEHEDVGQRARALGTQREDARPIVRDAAVRGGSLYQ